jgi:hypothetical protein
MITAASRLEDTSVGSNALNRNRRLKIAESWASVSAITSLAAQPMGKHAQQTPRRKPGNI